MTLILPHLYNTYSEFTVASLYQPSHQSQRWNSTEMDTGCTLLTELLRREENDEYSNGRVRDDATTMDAVSR
jgi:hypothetical protein